ncbi:expressed unknown protein [Seminavis robusta]|uniref:Uncharacterized protein n=1 Tax=Seminavis robusta TaxID=568900 RepID=A0A9N8DYB7_9STRA|nr:expressed unknown protein [Seminavis robusta]|eukprot:Sro374_g129300.1 n/a (1088) ;mRNA; r:57144-60624
MTQPSGDDNDDEAAAALEAPKQEQKAAAAKKETAEDKEEGDDNGESSSTSSSQGQGSGEGYTADCSSDASSDLSGSAKKKEKKEKKDNIILSVNNLSLEDGSNGADANGAAAKGTEGEKTKKNSKTDAGKGKNGSSKPPPGSQAGQEGNKKDKPNKKDKKKRRRSSTAKAETATDNPANDGADSDSDMSDTLEDGMMPLAQWNGVQVVHPMDPRIDISKVGYLHGSPVPRSGHDGQPKQEEAPSLEHYVQLMEVVRPFFNSYGLVDEQSPQVPSEAGLPRGNPLAAMPSNITQPASSSMPDYRAGASGEDSRTSTSLSCTRSSSSQSSHSGRRQRNAPLHLLSHQDVATNAPKPPQVPLQLAARQRPLAAAAAAEFYAPDDDPAEDDEEDDSDTSSMVVLARTKRKHKQPSFEPQSSQEDSIGSIRDHPSDTARRDADRAAAEAGGANDQVDMDDDEDDRKPAARPQAPRQQEEAPNQNQDEELPPPDDDEAAQAGNASSSSSSDQRIQPGPPANQPRHNYADVAHVVSESASNTNTTTSGSGSGSGSGANSGSNQGSSGSGNGSSGSGNGSSGSGNEGKGSSEDAGNKEEVGGASNSNSEDVNSDDKQLIHKKEIAHPVAAQRHGASAVADGGANDPMKLDAPSPQAPSDQNIAARERKLQDKKRKRMNMRREYEEKVQQEMESSESSAAKNVVFLRPGRPVTLDKVLSFTKIARMVIQAGPPFLVVHTNAAYTRLTGIDAHAAVGKPVSTLLAVQEPSSMNRAGDAAIENVARAPSNANLNQAAVPGGVRQNQLGAFQVETMNSFQRQGQSHAEAEEAGRARAAQASQNDSGNINLERLVAACGFGKYLVLHARSRPHHMVGRNVTFVTKTGPAGSSLPPAAAASAPAVHSMRKLDDGSSDTSLTSNFEGPFDFLKCRSSISPILSDTIDSAVVTDTNQEPHSHKNKRRKHHHHHHHGSTEQQGSANASMSGGHPHNHLRRGLSSKDSVMIPKRYQQCITHYAIQLELFDDSKELNDESKSSSSTSVEANLLGLTKAELRRQRQAAQTGQHGTSQEESEQRQQQEDDDEMASETTEGTAPVTAVG